MKKIGFKMLVSLMIVALLSVSVNAYAASPDNSKAPAARNAKVTMEDISSLNDYISSHTLETQTLSTKIEASEVTAERSNKKSLQNTNLSTDWTQRLSGNKELLEFTKISAEELKNTYVDSIFMGKIQNQYDVYLSTFELPNISVMTQYDINRNLLIDAYVIDHTDESNVIITDRNIGLVFEGPLADLLQFKNGTQQDKENFKSKYKEKINVVSVEKNSFSLLGLGITTVSAGNVVCPDGVSGTACSWISVGYCALAGLAGFWPGLGCAIFYTWGCSQC